jgi:hypothetical protein
VARKEGQKVDHSAASMVVQREGQKVGHSAVLMGVQRGGQKVGHSAVLMGVQRGGRQEGLMGREMSRLILTRLQEEMAVRLVLPK